MRNRNSQTLTNDQLQSMTTEELHTLSKRYKSEITNLRKASYKKKILEMECCYIQRELEFRSAWTKHEGEILRFAQP